MTQEIICQQILRTLNSVYPTHISAGQIIDAPFFAAVQTPCETILDALKVLVSAGYLIDTFGECPTLGHWYKLTHQGLLQITRRTRLDPAVWGAEAL